MNIIAAFPGVGITEYVTTYPHVAYLDPNSLTFDYQHQSFLDQLRWRIAQGLFTVVDATPTTLKQLSDAGLEFVLVYPTPKLLTEYQARYLAAPAPHGGAAYSATMSDVWYLWLATCATQRCFSQLVLTAGETLVTRLPFHQDPDYILLYPNANEGDNGEG